MSKETGLTLYDDSPFAQLLKKIQSFSTNVYNFLFPQSKKPLVDSSGKIFPDDILEVMRRDDIGFLIEVSGEENNIDNSHDEIEAANDKEVGPKKSISKEIKSVNDVVEVHAREEDDIPLFTESRLEPAIIAHNNAIKIGNEISRKGLGNYTKDKHHKGGKHTKDSKRKEIE